MKVDISGPAKAQVRERRAWWRTHRDAKSAFAEELKEARRALRDPPAAEIFCYHRGRPVYRYLMKRVHCHLYYYVHRDENLVEIIAAAGEQQGNPPDLG